MLNGVQIGTIGRQEEEVMAVFLGDGRQVLLFVKSGIVEDQG